MTDFNFNKDYEIELIQNPEWCAQVMQGLEILKANHCYATQGTGGSWGTMKIKQANWTSENISIWSQLNTVYRWLAVRFEDHEVTKAIKEYTEMGWYFVTTLHAVEKAKTQVNQEVKAYDNCYFLNDGVTTYKIENAGEWDSDWVLTNHETGTFVKKFYKLEDAIKFAKW